MSTENEPMLILWLFMHWQIYDIRNADRRIFSLRPDISKRQSWRIILGISLQVSDFWADNLQVSLFHRE